MCPRRPVLALLALGALVGGPRSLRAQEATPAVELGTYERQALATALARRKLTVDPAPSGKQLGRIHVVNLDVFSDREGFLQWFNIFHRTTRDPIIEREVILRPGDQWDEEIIAETKRRLQDPLFTTLVVLVPVKSAAADKVDLLVVTRDIWSLRMNSTFEVQGGGETRTKLTELSVSLSENNLFGLRKHAAFVFDMNQSQFSLGPQYIDKNIRGSRLVLSSRVSTRFGRESKKFEGTSSSTSLSYPLWSLQRKWGGSLSVSHFDSTIRQFQGTALRPYDNPDTDEIESIPRVFKIRTLGTEASATRSLGKSIKHRVSAGHRLSVRRPSFRDNFGNVGLAMPDAANIAVARAAFERDVMPRSERVSALFLRYNMFTPQFVVYRDMDAFDLPENARLGPSFTVETSAALEVLGAENNFVGVGSSVSWLQDIMRDGFVRGSASVAGRIQSGDFIDGNMGGSLKFATPTVANVFRVVGRASYAQLIDDTNNSFLSVGGNNGLRGYEIQQFTGRRRVRGNLELRTRPLKIWFGRAGLTVFWDTGHAADRLKDLRLHHDIGLGLRTLVPQLQPFVFRVDYALPLTGGGRGFPGRFSAGVAQAF